MFCGFLLTVDVIRKYRCMICFEKLGPIYRYIFGILIGPATRKSVRTGTLSVFRSPAGCDNVCANCIDYLAPMEKQNICLNKSMDHNVTCTYNP